MGTFRPVRAVELLLPAGALLAALAALAAACRSRLSTTRAVRAAEALVTPLGDALLVLDERGRILRANEAAGQLAGVAPERLAGAALATLGGDLPLLARGLARGPASAVVSLAAGGRTVRVRAALVRAPGRPPRDLVVLRPLPLPPPLPPPRPVRAAAPAEPAEPAQARAALAGAAAAVREPLARAARAASLLRLAAPALGARPAAALAALEEALEDAERRAAALLAAGQPGARRPVDLSALVDEVVAAFAPPPGVRIRADLHPARAHADDRPLRAALRELLRCAAAALPAGGDVAVSVVGDGAAPRVLVAAPAAAARAVGALARALLAPHGARLDEEETAGGWRLVIALPAAPAEALAPA